MFKDLEKITFCPLALFVRVNLEQISFGTATEASAKPVSKATNIIVNRVPMVNLSVWTLYERYIIARNPVLGMMCTDSGIRLRAHGIEIGFKII